MLASFGKMPTTPAYAGAGAGPPFDLFIQPFQGVGAVPLGPVLEREGHIGEPIVLAVVHQRSELGPASTPLISNVPPSLMSEPRWDLRGLRFLRGWSHG